MILWILAGRLAQVFVHSMPHQSVNDIQVIHGGSICCAYYRYLSMRGWPYVTIVGGFNKFLFHPAMLGPCGAIRPHYLMSPILRHNYFLDRGAKQGWRVLGLRSAWAHVNGRDRLHLMERPATFIERIFFPAWLALFWYAQHLYIYIHSSCNHDYLTAICSRRTSTPKNLGNNSCSARFMLVYKTPTIVSTDLFDLEKLGDPRSTEGIRLLGMFPGFDSKNSLFGNHWKERAKSDWFGLRSWINPPPLQDG